MGPSYRIAKENKYLNMKNRVDRYDIKDQDQALLEKYGARFGIKEEEYFGGNKQGKNHQNKLFKRPDYEN